MFAGLEPLDAVCTGKVVFTFITIAKIQRTWFLLHILRLSFMMCNIFEVRMLLNYSKLCDIDATFVTFKSDTMQWHFRTLPNYQWV